MKTMKWVAAAATLAVGVSSCSLSPIQAATLGPREPAASPTWSVGSKLPILGVNLYALHNYSAAQTTADGERTLSYIRYTLHADAVDLVWNMYVPGGHTASKVVTDSSTLSAANIGILTRLAKQKYGLMVEYRPMLFIQATGNTWEGLIKPANPAAWFSSYYAKNLPYLKVAQRYRINEYVIGTEMNRLSPDPHWPGFLAKAATVFKGEISYTANQHLYFPPDTQMPATRLTGMDMYEPLTLPASASLGEVVAAYEQFFTTVPTALLQRTAIQETGIEARAGAYSNPPDLRAAGTLDEAVQYNWFIAGCRAVKRFHMRGVFFWKVDLSDFPRTHPANSLSTFEGKRGALAIIKCASILHS
jgi:hypothetical protein